MNTPNTVKHIGRNTNNGPKVSPKRARSWCFTWNNHTPENWHTCTDLYLKMKINKMICQEEKGKNGTKHIQGFIQFKNAINLKTLKNIDKKIHWEICKNIQASINYCSKNETKDGKSYSFGIRSDTKTKFDINEYFKYMKEVMKELGKKELQLKLDILSGLAPPKKNNK